MDSIAPSHDTPAAVRNCDHPGRFLSCHSSFSWFSYIYGDTRLGTVGITRLEFAPQSAAARTCASLTTTTNSVKMTDTTRSPELPGRPVTNSNAIREYPRHPRPSSSFVSFRTAQMVNLGKKVSTDARRLTQICRRSSRLFLIRVHPCSSVDQVLSSENLYE